MADPIKLTNAQVLESTGALSTLSQVKLPAKAAYAVAKAAHKLAELEKSIRTVQRGLWDKYGEKDEKGKLKVGENGQITVPAAVSAEFVKELNDLFEIPNEVTGLRLVTLAELGEVSIEPAALVPLGWLINDA